MTSEKTTDSTEKDDISSVDAASLLATLSNIGNGTLANLTIPGLNSPTPPPQQQQQQTEEKILPPALAKLLDGLVSSPSPTTTAMSNSPTPPLPVDPRIRPNNNDPRIVTQQDQPISTTLSSSSKNLKHWPPPQGPSITRRTERKSRWGHDEQQQQDPRLMNFQNTTAVPPPSFITPPSTSYHQQQQTDPFNDPTLPPGCIKVLTRTLFVGPIPDHYEEEDVSQLFSKYGELASVIVAKKIKGRHNAFLKFTTRASTQIAKEESEGLVVEAVPVKVNWAFGFGPKKHFNFDRGESIIPLAELSDEEKSNLVTAPVGGFQGQMLRDRTVIEEPEAQYRPEWKYDHPEDHQQQQQQQQRGGFKRHHQQQQQYDEGGFIRKRGRFNNINNRSTQANSGFYQQQQQQPLPPPPPPTFPTSNTNNNSYYNNRSSSTFPNNNIPQQQYYSNQQPY
ncbi:MAG: hypothetical protein EXX96DRAFT_158102 [Benjaminiella poitrasii]|nr:MAG: hypothetical protein EXX96DRAFT_158102 [Benjaminiella poitrasii]